MTRPRFTAPASDWHEWFVRHPDHYMKGSCLSHPGSCGRRCLDDRPAPGLPPWPLFHRQGCDCLLCVPQQQESDPSFPGNSGEPSVTGPRATPRSPMLHAVAFLCGLFSPVLVPLVRIFANGA